MMNGLGGKLALTCVGIAIVGALASSFLPSGSLSRWHAPTPTQKERIVSSAQQSGASNVRLRAAQAEAERQALPPQTNGAGQAPVVLNEDGSLAASTAPSVVAQASTAQNQQQSSGIYGGTAPVPTITFADSANQEPETTEPIGNDE